MASQVFYIMYFIAKPCVGVGAANLDFKIPYLLPYKTHRRIRRTYNLTTNRLEGKKGKKTLKSHKFHELYSPPLYKVLDQHYKPSDSPLLNFSAKTWVTL